MIQSYIKPNWPAPAHIHAYTSIRCLQGFSQGPYSDFNLAHHVGDDPFSVAKNRAKLREDLRFAQDPLWLDQVHGHTIVCLTETTNSFEVPPRADAIYTQRSNAVCAILTADCLPILITNREGTEIAAVHAGWRGLLDTIIEETLTHLCASHADIFIWLGPGISQTAFEVGSDVKTAFLKKNPAFETAFVLHQTKANKWFADLYHIARIILQEQKINSANIFGGNFCTYTDPRFYSYRRDSVTGRMATLIWRSS